MKKILLVFALVFILLLCSCSKMNQVPDTNNNYTDNNSSETDFDTSSVISDFTLPERDDPSTSTQESESDNVVTSNPEYEHEDTISSDVKVSDNLSIDVHIPYYRSSVNYISFTLYSDGGVFTYYTDFFLQKYENGKWEYYPTKNGEINYKFNVAKSTSNTETINYDLKNLYNTPLPYGKYRFIQHNDFGSIESREFEIVEDSFFDGEQPQ